MRYGDARGKGRDWILTVNEKEGRRLPSGETSREKPKLIRLGQVKHQLIHPLLQLSDVQWDISNPASQRPAFVFSFDDLIDRVLDDSSCTSGIKLRHDVSHNVFVDNRFDG